MDAIIDFSCSSRINVVEAIRVLADHVGEYVYICTPAGVIRAVVTFTAHDYGCGLDSWETSILLSSGDRMVFSTFLGTT